jgi:hypothetical protein
VCFSCPAAAAAAALTATAPPPADHPGDPDLLILANTPRPAADADAGRADRHHEPNREHITKLL